MTTNQIILGLLTAAFVFGAYFLGWFQGRRHPIESRGFFRGMIGPLTRRGFAWSVALPAAWVLLYYAFIAHVWFSLGRWPDFGESLNGKFLSFHHDAIRYFFAALVVSLYVAPVVLGMSLLIRKWRHISAYVLSYGGAVALASCALFFFAPHAFRNWLFD